MFIKKLLKKNINFNLIRNTLSFKPSAYISPKIKKTSVSDFFFYKESEDFNSKIMLFNLSSHVLPEIKQSENIELFFFNKNGLLINKYQTILSYQETKEILISDIIKNNSGSFFAFHTFKNFGNLLEKNSYITERGYAAYKSKHSIWSYMHGNHNAAYLDNDSNIHSIIGSSFRDNNPYLPQVSFLDQEEFDIIINNPSKKSNLISLILRDEREKIVDKKSFEVKPYGTNIYNCKKKINILELNSKNILNRPIIIKYYKDNFDIFHG
jgi:hypothetical protein